MRTKVVALSPSDSAKLKSVFYSGEPWLVQCGSKADLASSSVDAGLSVHEVVELALPKLPSEAKVGVLDCARKLPSGKTPFPVPRTVPTQGRSWNIEAKSPAGDFTAYMPWSSPFGCLS